MLTEGEIPQKKEARVKIIIPIRKILFRPRISAARPAGIRNTAPANRYEVAIQPVETALVPKSAPIVGSAILMEELIKGVRKEANDATSSVAFFSEGEDPCITIFSK
jgi:hypothetical protein